MTREEAIEKIKRWKLEIDDEKDYADYLEGWFYKDDEIAFDMAIEALGEQKIGKWIKAQFPFEQCSVCGAYFDTWNNEANYCCVCGTRMEGEKK